MYEGFRVRPHDDDRQARAELLLKLIPGGGTGNISLTQDLVENRFCGRYQLAPSAEILALHADVGQKLFSISYKTRSAESALNLVLEWMWKKRTCINGEVRPVYVFLVALSPAERELLLDPPLGCLKRSQR